MSVFDTGIFYSERTERKNKMKQYYVEYYTQSGQKVGMTISALNATEAVIFARRLPDFRTLVSYPQEV